MPAVIAALISLPSSADARPQYPSQVPNGNTNLCMTCHNSPTGGVPGAPDLNPFGLDTQGSLDGDAKVDWASICTLDSDGDGFTNGEELGDLDCIWSEGDADPSVETVYNPGDDTSVPPGAPAGGDDTADATGDTSGGGGDATGGGTTSSGDDGCAGGGTDLGGALVAFAAAALLTTRRRRVAQLG